MRPPETFSSSSRFSSVLLVSCFRAWLFMVSSIGLMVAVLAPKGGRGMCDLSHRKARMQITFVTVLANRLFLAHLRESELMLRVIAIATAIGLAAPSYAQVRVITGDVEHVYGPGGEVLDSPELTAKNQRAKRQIRSEERVVGPVEQQRLSIQQSGPRRAPDDWWSNDAARRQPPKSWWNNNGYQPPKSAWSSQ